MDALIRLDEVTKRYDSGAAPAVDGVSLQIAAGERVDRLNETGVARFRRQKVGMIFQFFNLLDDLTVLDNVLLPAQLAGVPRGKARARADELLAALRIGPHRQAYP